MNRFYLFLLSFVLNYFSVFAQVNLVPNPSFELHNNCPYLSRQILFADYWQVLVYSPDYFHKCSTTIVSIPYNGAGFQETRNPLDSAYAGLGIHISLDTGRTFLGVAFTDTLQIGVQYFISFYISGGSRSEITDCSCNKLGAKLFTDISILRNGMLGFMDNQADLFVDSVISDTTNWIQIKGRILADSAYTGIAIGNFFDLDHTTISCFGSSGHLAYYYIDDVCVSSDSATCFVTTGIPVNPAGENVSIHYSSSSHSLIIQNSNANYSDPYPLFIYDSVGQIVFSKEITDNETTVGLPYLAASVYIVNYKNFRLKFVVEN